MNFLGIDLGTSSVKIIIMNDDGQVVSSVSKDFEVSYPKTNWAEQNPEDWWKATREGIKEILAKAVQERKDISGIGLSGQMHGLVLLDKDYNVLRPAILWCDQRTEEECEYLNNVIGREKLTAYTGNMALTGFTLPKVLWVKNHEPELFHKVAYMLLPKDYIRFKLTGEMATEVSDASGTLMFDVEKRNWAQELLDLLKIKKETLPKVYESSEITGKVTVKVAEFTGLSTDTVVVGGAGDQAAGAVGTGTVSSGILSVALGTSGVVFAASDKYEVDNENRLHSFCHSNGRWHQMGVMLSAAASLKWWVEDVNEKLEVEAFEKLLEEASKSTAGAKGIIFLPYLMGERTPHNDPDSKGIIYGLNINHKRGDITRAILEGVCFGLRDSLEILRDLNVPMKEVRVSGGGSKSPLWRQILADIFNVKVEVINSKEGSAYGAAILAAVGCGLFNSVDEACEKLIRVTNTVEPIAENVKKYDEIYSLFTEIYPLLKGSFKRLKNIMNK